MEHIEKEAIKQLLTNKGLAGGGIGGRWPGGGGTGPPADPDAPIGGMKSVAEDDEGGIGGGKKGGCDEGAICGNAGGGGIIPWGGMPGGGIVGGMLGGRTPPTEIKNLIEL